MLPHLLSLLRLPLGVLLYVLVLRRQPWPAVAALGVVVAAALTDYFDGALARRLGVVTVLGKWLDALCDAAFFAWVYLSLMRIDLMPPVLFALFAARELLQYAVIRPLSTSRGLDPGAKLPGKIKTGLQVLGSCTILVLLALSLDGLLAPEILRRVCVVALSVMVAVSVVSLGWYVAPLLRSLRDE